jgi:hypothetical protein
VTAAAGRIGTVETQAAGVAIHAALVVFSLVIDEIEALARIAEVNGLHTMAAMLRRMSARILSKCASIGVQQRLQASLPLLTNCPISRE